MQSLIVLFYFSQSLVHPDFEKLAEMPETESLVTTIQQISEDVDKIESPKANKIEAKEETILSYTPTPISIAPSQPPVLTETLTPTPIPTTIVPTSTPTPTTVPSITLTQPMLEELFNRYSAQYGADNALLKKIAKCESSFNPNATNGIYGGMFQFAPQSWQSQRTEMGQDPNPDLRFSAEESIKTAAYSISKGRAGMWKGCL